MHFFYEKCISIFFTVIIIIFAGNWMRRYNQI